MKDVSTQKFDDWKSVSIPKEINALKTAVNGLRKGLYFTTILLLLHILIEVVERVL